MAPTDQHLVSRVLTIAKCSRSLVRRVFVLSIIIKTSGRVKVKGTMDAVEAVDDDGVHQR